METAKTLTTKDSRIPDYLQKYAGDNVKQSFDARDVNPPMVILCQVQSGFLEDNNKIYHPDAKKGEYFCTSYGINLGPKFDFVNFRYQKRFDVYKYKANDANDRGELLGTFIKETEAAAKVNELARLDGVGYNYALKQAHSRYIGVLDSKNQQVLFTALFPMKGSKLSASRAMNTTIAALNIEPRMVIFTASVVYEPPPKGKSTGYYTSKIEQKTGKTGLEGFVSEALLEKVNAAHQKVELLFSKPNEADKELDAVNRYIEQNINDDALS